MAHFSGDLSKSEKLSEIKAPLQKHPNRLNIFLMIVYGFFIVISKPILMYVIKIIWFLSSDAFLFTQLWIEVAITQSKVSIYFN